MASPRKAPLRSLMSSSATASWLELQHLVSAELVFSIIIPNIIMEAANEFYFQIYTMSVIFPSLSINASTSSPGKD
jgi:hypothetical protein